MISSPESASRADRILAELLSLAFRLANKREFLAEVDRAQSRLAEEFATSSAADLAARILALRLANLVVSRHHFHHRHTRLASRPIQLMLDPVNNCHLSCPGCLHSGNDRFAGAYDWPSGALSTEDHDRILALLGPTAWGAVYYNWGEPLLGKRTPELLSRAKQYRLHTCVSTNLSVKFDAEALVASGVNFLFLSIDGATQEVYSKFRRGGRLELCLDNIRRLVEARRRLGSPTPFLLWRFLTFEHNVHEVEAALALANQTGVDQFSVTTPFAVAWDDPSIRVARSPLEGAHLLRSEASFRGPLDDWRRRTPVDDAIERECDRPWRERLPDTNQRDESSRPTSPACAWLYQSLTFDARARIFPCCMAPERGLHKVYGSLDASEGDPFNVGDLQLSRLAFADRDEFERRPSVAGPSAPPYCAVCHEKPEMTYTLDRDVARDLSLADARGLVSPETVAALTRWPASR
jgi:MoaA/NifB/PqqE/SkfB family radical SAM enzyme